MPAGSEDRVAEIESEVHIVPALQVVFGERQADRSDGRVIDVPRVAALLCYAA